MMMNVIVDLRLPKTFYLVLGTLLGLPLSRLNSLYIVDHVRPRQTTSKLKHSLPLHHEHSSDRCGRYSWKTSLVLPRETHHLALARGDLQTQTPQST